MGKIQLLTSDDTIFDVNIEFAKNSTYLAKALQECNEKDGTCIPLPDITSPLLEKVLIWMEKHRDYPMEKCIANWKTLGDPLTEWQEMYFEKHRSCVFDLLIAANYLGVKSLIYFSSKTIAYMMSGHTTAELRARFHIENDLTPEEEEKIRRSFQWTADGYDGFDMEEEEEKASTSTATRTINIQVDLPNKTLDN